MKKIIFQINIPNEIKKNKFTCYGYMPEMYKVSELYAKKYAQKYGAEYYTVNTPNDFKPAEGKHLDYQKLKAYDFKEYDRIIYFDSDYIIKDNAPNLFEICGNNFAAVLDQNRNIAQIAKEIDVPIDRYFNAGFMYLTKNILDQTRDVLLTHYIKKDFPWDGQGLLNKIFYDQGIDFIKLNPKEWNLVKGTFALYADHYAANKKKRWGEVIYPI